MPGPALALVPVAAAPLAVPAGTSIGAVVGVGGALVTVASVASTTRVLMDAAQLAAKGYRVVRWAASSASSAASSKAKRKSSRPELTDHNREMIGIIERECNAAALPPLLAASRPALTLAAVINAWHESRLKPWLTNFVGRDSSWGLFQINRQGPLGKPHSPKMLLDPAYNTRVILSEVWNRRQELEAVLARGGTVQDLTAAFTEHVERPANRSAVGRARGATVREWWGDSVAGAKAHRWRT